jgi:hypothetical protein
MAGKTPRKPFESTTKDLEAKDRLDNFEIQRLAGDSSDPEEGGEIARGLAPDPQPIPYPNLASSDPEEGGEVHMPADDGGEIAMHRLLRAEFDVRLDIAEDPDAGGEIYRAEQEPEEEEVPQTVTAAVGIAVAEDPDGGGEIASSDPEEGGELTDFGAGAVAARAVTMTAADLGVAEDPDAGGEVAIQPDRAEPVHNLADLDPSLSFAPDLAEPEHGLVDVDGPDAFQPDAAEPTNNLVDLELAGDLDQAQHTFDPE